MPAPARYLSNSSWGMASRVILELERSILRISPCEPYMWPPQRLSIGTAARSGCSAPGVLRRNQAHGVFRQGGDGQAGIDAGVGGHGGGIDHIQTGVVVDL